MQRMEATFFPLGIRSNFTTTIPSVLANPICNVCYQPSKSLLITESIQLYPAETREQQYIPWSRPHLQRVGPIRKKCNRKHYVSRWKSSAWHKGIPWPYCLLDVHYTNYSISNLLSMKQLYEQFFPVARKRLQPTLWTEAVYLCPASLALGNFLWKAQSPTGLLATLCDILNSKQNSWVPQSISGGVLSLSSQSFPDHCFCSTSIMQSYHKSLQPLSKVSGHSEFKCENQYGCTSNRSLSSFFLKSPVKQIPQLPKHLVLLFCWDTGKFFQGLS